MLRLGFKCFNPFEHARRKNYKKLLTHATVDIPFIQTHTSGYIIYYFLNTFSFIRRGLIIERGKPPPIFSEFNTSMRFVVNKVQVLLANTKKPQMFGLD